MNYIENIIEPDTLLLSWQPTKASGKPRMRRFVAELSRSGDYISMKYLVGSEDFEIAKQNGFTDYPGFSADKIEHENVLPAFMRRLPPRNRNDFNRFLSSIRINPNDREKVSDFALLGYSGARLPGDTFSIINPFVNVEPPFDIYTEVQGYRHYKNSFDELSIKEGLNVTFEQHPENQYDQNAVAIMINNCIAGYLCRGLNKSFVEWSNSGFQIDGYIECVNGTIDEPKLYVLIHVS